MAIEAKTGTINCPASTGNTGFTGVGFQPKAIIFYWTLQTADGTGADMALGIGTAASSSQENLIFMGADDNVSTSDSSRSSSNAACIRALTPGTATVVMAADLVSFDADGFTLNFTTVTSGVDIHYLALGGDSITNAAAGTQTSPAATGNQAVTGLGFQPDFVLFIWSRHTADDGSTNGNALLGIGAATSSTARWALQGRTTHSELNAETAKIQRTDHCIVSLNTTADSINGSADFVSMDSGGFTINWDDATSDSMRWHYICLKGGNYNVGTISQKTSTGNQGYTGVGFQPSGIFLASANKTSGTTVVVDNEVSIGSGTSSANRASAWGGDNDNADPMECDSDSDTTKIIKLFSAGTPTLNAAADLVSLDSDGFTLNWTTADATAREICYVAFGPGGPTTVTKTFTADGIVKVETTKTFTADGIVKSQTTKTFTADGIIKAQTTLTFTADGIVFAQTTKTFTVDGIVKAETTKTFTIDGIVSERKTTTFTIDGIIKAQTTATFTVDGVIKAQTTKTFTVDGIVKEQKTTTFTADGIVKAQTTATFTVDGIIKAETTKTFTIDGVVKAETTKTFTIDGIVLVQTTKTFTADGIVKAETTKTFTIDGIVKAETTKTFTLDGIVKVQTTKTFTADGVIKAETTKTFTADGIVLVQTIKTFTADGLVLAQTTADFTVDGNMFATNTASFTLDGVIGLLLYPYLGGKPPETGLVTREEDVIVAHEFIDRLGL